MSIKGLSALLLEDDAGLRSLVGRILENAGMQVFESSDAETALILAREKRPHIILADLHLPGDQSGYDFIARVCSHAELLHIPVIAWSGSTGESAVRKAFSSGANDFIAKPLDAALLLQKVRKQLHDTDFLEVQLAEAFRAPITVQIPCSVTAANAEGVILECSARLSPEQKVRFSSEICRAMGLDVAFPLAVAGSLPCDQSGYRNELKFRGLSRAQLAALEEVIARWHTHRECS